MVITGMNRFFAKHGRVAFFLIAVVISVAFVMFMTGQSVFDLIFKRNTGPKNIVILGREVDRDQRIDAVDRVLIQQSLLFPSRSLENPDYQKLDQWGISNLMSYYAAQDRGIAIGDEEIKKYIRSIPAFQNKGEFDEKKFNEFVIEKLSPRHFDKADLDDAIRAQLAVEKLREEIGASVIIPAEEIREAYLNVNEKAKVKTTEFNASTYSKKVTVSDEEAKSYYEANKEKYMTPPAVQIDVVRFEYGKFRKEAYNKITEDEVKTYYNKNKYQFIKKEEKKKKEKKKEDKKEDKKATKKEEKKKLEYEPLKKVTPGIKDKLVDGKSKELAAKAATAFSDGVYDLTKDVFYNIKDTAIAQAKCREVFVNYAKKAKQTVFNPGWINKGDKKLESLGNEPEIVKTALDLFVDEPISEPIKGNQAAFVILLIEKRAPQPETFEKQKAKILADLKKSKAINLAREAARELALKIGEALDKGRKFEDITKKLKVPFKAFSQELTAPRPPYGQEQNGYAIHQAAFATPQGQVGAVQETGNGALLVYVETKFFPTEKEFEAQKAMFGNYYKSQKKRAVLMAYMQSLSDASEMQGKKGKKAE